MEDRRPVVEGAGHALRAGQLQRGIGVLRHGCET
jgi:hypothetical protein